MCLSALLDCGQSAQHLAGLSPTRAKHAEDNCVYQVTLPSSAEMTSLHFNKLNFQIPNIFLI